ncbi:MAG TPA: hypothetical protein VND98_06940 [Solirubrobacterales bacterium]|nr:hypothetical protein [Solirubrobacterales bacterium]
MADRRSGTSAFVLGLLFVCLGLASPEGALATGAITDFPLPVERSDPQGITLGHEGDLWFTEWGTEKIGRITPGGQVTEFPLPALEPGRLTAGPVGITTGPEGDLWFTVPHRQMIGRITPSGQITEFQVKLGQENEPQLIVAGPDGNLWFTEPRHEHAYREPEEPTAEERRGKIGRITPSGEITEFPLKLPPPRRDTQPSGVAAGPSGDVWFMEFGVIGRITPAGQITEFPSSAGKGTIAAGPEGNLWFTDGSKIGSMTPQGQVSSYALAGTPRVAASAVTAGPDGNVWFFGAQEGGIRPLPGAPVVGRVSPSGRIVDLADEAGPVQDFLGEGPLAGGITTGAEGIIWFTEPWANRIARIAPAALSAEMEITEPRATVSRSRAHLRLACLAESACRGVVRLHRRSGAPKHEGRATGTVIAHAKFNIRGRQHKDISVPLSHKVLALFASHRRLSVLATASILRGKAVSRTVVLEARRH